MTEPREYMLVICLQEAKTLYYGCEYIPSRVLARDVAEGWRDGLAKARAYRETLGEGERILIEPITHATYWLLVEEWRDE